MTTGPLRTTPVVISLCACAAIGAPKAPAIVAMASIWFRMFQLLRDDARRLLTGPQSDPIHRARHCSGNNDVLSAAIFGISPMPEPNWSDKRLLSWNRPAG
jgi:hypothetical protein